MISAKIFTQLHPFKSFKKDSADIKLYNVNTKLTKTIQITMTVWGTSDCKSKPQGPAKGLQMCATNGKFIFHHYNPNTHAAFKIHNVYLGKILSKTLIDEKKSIWSA